MADSFGRKAFPGPMGAEGSMARTHGPMACGSMGPNGPQGLDLGLRVWSSPPPWKKGLQRNQIRKVAPEGCQTLKIQIWVLGTWYLVLSTWYPEGCQTLKTQMLVLGTWYLVLGTWSLALGT